MIQSISELYLKEIKDNLRNSHAAVLVGSGFSMNAVRMDGTKAHMPDWFGLADAFSEKLGMDSLSKDLRYANPLTLAQQVIEVYGRPYMNSLLRGLMDDDAYAPGAVHELLISLPWTDIFTTNYDTLLERAYQTGTKRRYKVVYNQDDLLYSAGTPRIVKLHGSFPSHEPFIIAEEDYRRYPKDFAPFVNTVQQSLLENLFILIGFSGTDPNFLNWIGWIHDNLGQTDSPKMYMIVHKPESEVRTKMLAARNIDVVVLNDIPGCRSDSYGKSIELFLKGLTAYVVKTDKDKTWPQFLSLPYDASAGKILDGLNALQESYPGWITARFSCLNMSAHLLSKFDFYIRKTGNDEKVKDEDYDLELNISEKFCWFCDVVGSYTSIYTINALEKILKRHDNKEKTDAFIKIELFILKYYRFTGDNKWEQVYRSLKKKVRKTVIWSELYAELTYEYAMHLLYTFDWEKLEDVVRMIACDEEHGEWILRKAGLLSMLGYHKEALGMLRKGIEYARRILLKIDRDNRKVYNRFSSLESCMISLLRYIQQTYDAAMMKPDVLSLIQYEDEQEDIEAEYGKGGEGNREEQKTEDNDIRRHSLIDDYSDRRNYVDDYICNLENEKFANRVSDPYKPRPSVAQKVSFDIDRISETRNFGGDDEGLAAERFISFREIIGQPFHIGTVTNKDGLQGAISRLNWVNHRTAVILSVLMGGKKEIETALNRMSLAGMSVEEVDCLVRELVKLMDYCMGYVCQREKASMYDFVIHDYALEVVPEALSRLVTKCSAGVFKLVIDLLKKIYASQMLEQFIDADHLVERTINMMPYEVFEEVLGEFWDMDIKPDNPYLNSHYPDPFYHAYIKVLSYRYEQIYDMTDEQIGLFKGWIYSAKEKALKKPALSRLSFIYKIYKLPAELTDSLKHLIWAKDNLDRYGLPDLGIFSRVMATDYPHDGDDKDLLNSAGKYLVDRYKYYIKEGVLTDFSNLFHMTERLMESVDIDENKCNEGLKLAHQFCGMVDKYTKPEISWGIIDAKRILNEVDELVGLLLLKSGRASRERIVRDETVSKILKILDRAGCPHALTSWCISSEDRYEKIVSSVLSSDPSYTQNANKAIYHLVNSGIDVDERIVTLMTHSVATTLAYNVNSYALGLEHLIRRGLMSDDNIMLVSEALPKFDQITSIDILDDEDEVIKKTAMRKVISLLARTIFRRCEADEKGVPEGVMYWKKLVENPDEFAEIRVVWDMDVNLLKD